jgi:hypothetical protein
MKRTVNLLRQAVFIASLWLSLMVNLYFLIFQPPAVFSLRRLAFSAAAALLAALLLWLLKERGFGGAGWQRVSPQAWWIGIILTLVLFLIAPAPRLYTLIAPVDVRLQFAPLDQEEAPLYLIWLNNGLGDLSFSDMELPPTAEITPEGVWLTARQNQPVEVGWRGRIWGELLVTVRSETPLRLMAQVGNRTTEILIEGGAVERAVHLPSLSFLYYVVLYVLVMAVGSLSLVWLGQLGLVGWARVNRRYPSLLARLVQYLPSISLVGVAIFYLFTLRSGHPWGDDFAQYIAHARNLAQGQPYTAIGILHNPGVVLGPTAYPPLLPFLLAPLYALFGLNLTVFKLVGVACALGALWLFEIWLRERFQAPLRGLAVLLAGLQPWFWDYKDQILSDMPFVLLGMLSLLLWERWRDSRSGVKGWMVGLAVAAAIAARSVGLILLAALLADAVIRRRWQRRDFLMIIGIPLLAVVLLNILLPSTGDYLEQARSWSWLTVQGNLSSIVETIDQIWRTELLSVRGISLISVVGVTLLILGLFFHLRNSGAVEWYFFGTFLMIAVWPYPQGFRFYLPILFFIIYYVLSGWQQLDGFFTTRTNRLASDIVQKGISYLVLVVFTAGVLQGYLSDYRRTPLREFETGIGLPASRQMFAYIREETRPEDVIAFFKPRALALFTERTAFAPYWNPQQPQRLLEDLAVFGADYLVVWKPDYGDLAAFARNQSPVLNLIFENDDFEIYSVAGLQP